MADPVVIHSTHKRRFAHYHGTVDTIECKNELNTVLIAIRDDVEVLYDTTVLHVNEGQMCLVEAEAPFRFRFMGRDADGYVLLINFDEMFAFCEKHIREYEEKHHPSYGDQPSVLGVTPAMKSFCHLMESYMEHFEEVILGDLKLKEFFFLLVFHSNIEEVAAFLHPLREHNNSAFRQAAIAAAGFNLTVEQWALSCGYSESLFRSHFRNEFGMTPGEWQRQQRKALIQKLLADPSITLVEVAERSELSSVQQLTRFCRQYMHGTPAQLRKDLLG